MLVVVGRCVFVVVGVLHVSCCRSLCVCGCRGAAC